MEIASFLVQHCGYPSISFGYLFLPEIGISAIQQCYFSAFAILQVKAIFCALLHRYRFEPVADPASYRDIMPSLILRPSEPCLLRYRRRDPE